MGNELKEMCQEAVEASFYILQPTWNNRIKGKPRRDIRSDLQFSIPCTFGSDIHYFTNSYTKKYTIDFKQFPTCFDAYLHHLQ
jgi:hypothetical protein